MIKTIEEIAALTSKLNTVTNDMADELSQIKQMMVGKGISPADSPLVQTRLLAIEQKLRMIASNPNNIIPFEV